MIDFLRAREAACGHLEVPFDRRARSRHDRIRLELQPPARQPVDRE